jgi:hypothetical protein
MYQADRSHTGVSPTATSSFGGALSLQRDVSLVNGIGFLTPAVFSPSRIFVGSGYGDRTLYSLRFDGTIAWSFALPANNGFTGAPAYIGRNVYAVSEGLADLSGLSLSITVDHG